MRLQSLTGASLNTYSSGLWWKAGLAEAVQWYGVNVGSISSKEGSISSKEGSLCGLVEGTRSGGGGKKVGGGDGGGGGGGVGGLSNRDSGEGYGLHNHGLCCMLSESQGRTLRAERNQGCVAIVPRPSPGDNDPQRSGLWRLVLMHVRNLFVARAFFSIFSTKNPGACGCRHLSEILTTHFMMSGIEVPRVNHPSPCPPSPDCYGKVTYPPRTTFRIIYCLVCCSVMEMFYFSVDDSSPDTMYLAILRSSRIEVVPTILSYLSKAETT